MYNPGIFLEGLRKTTEYLSQGSRSRGGGMDLLNTKKEYQLLDHNVRFLSPEKITDNE
jgi:hypothetical protein